jgi:uncharacterized protein (TIGR02246 family)
MSTEVKTSIELSLERMKRAWDTGDAGAYAAQFTTDASYVIYTGLCYLGRSAIENAHAVVFDKWQKGTTMALEILAIRQIGEQTAVVVTEGGVGKGNAVTRDKVQTFTMVRCGDQWLCAAFQNTKKNRFLMTISRLFS